MINDVAAYILENCETTPALVQGTNFFVGYMPDMTAQPTQPLLCALRHITGNYDIDFASQSHQSHEFRLQFLGAKFQTTLAFAVSICNQIRNVHGARIPSNDGLYVYHCAILTVSSPIHLATDDKGRFAFVASLNFLCQRLTQEGS